MAEFLHYLHARASNGEEAGDGLVKLGRGEDAVKCHELVLEWRGAKALLELELDLPISQAIQHWLYTSMLPQTVSLQELLTVIFVAHRIACLELQNCAINRLQLAHSQCERDRIAISEFALDNQAHFLLDSPLQVAQALWEANRRSSSPLLACLQQLHHHDTIPKDDVGRLKQICLALERIATEFGCFPRTALQEASFYCHEMLIQRLLALFPASLDGAIASVVASADLADEEKHKCLLLLLRALPPPLHAGIKRSMAGFALHEAARTDSPICLRELLQRAERFPLALQKPNGRTALHEAASVGSCRALQVLVEFADLETASLGDSHAGSTALHLAAQNGQDGAIKLILDAFPACVDLVDFAGRSALHRACGYIVDSLHFDLLSYKQQQQGRCNQLKLLQLLLIDYRANAQLITRADRTNALMWLLGGGGPATKLPSQILLDFIPRHVQEDDVLLQCARLLIKHTRVDHVARDGSTALHIAVRFGFPLVCRELVQAHGGLAGINALDSRGCSPLSLARTYWPNKLVARMILLPLPRAPPNRLETTACELCQHRFSTLFRRHHCRHCSACICARCSAHTLPLPHRNTSSSSSATQQQHRVCNYCHEALQVAMDEKGDEV